MLLHPYQPQWAVDFKSISSILLSAIADPEIKAEHIGSTAVPGLAAKAIIDLDLVFQTAAQFKRIKSTLEDLGYYHNGNQGIPGREVFKRSKAENIHPTLDEITHHLYVCRADSEELKRHLIFRNALREQEATRKAYQELKQAIAIAANQDRKTYAQLKEIQARSFIQAVLNNHY